MVGNFAPTSLKQAHYPDNHTISDNIIVRIIPSLLQCWINVSDVDPALNQWRTCLRQNGVNTGGSCSWYREGCVFTAHLAQQSAYSCRSSQHLGQTASATTSPWQPMCHEQTQHKTHSLISWIWMKVKFSSSRNLIWRFHNLIIIVSKVATTDTCMTIPPIKTHRRNGSFEISFSIVL